MKVVDEVGQRNQRRSRYYCGVSNMLHLCTFDFGMHIAKPGINPDFADFLGAHPTCLVEIGEGPGRKPKATFVIPAMGRRLGDRETRVRGKDGDQDGLKPRPICGDE